MTLTYTRAEDPSGEWCRAEDARRLEGLLAECTGILEVMALEGTLTAKGRRTVAEESRALLTRIREVLP